MDNQTRTRRDADKPKKHKKSKMKIIIAVIVALLVAAGAYGAYTYHNAKVALKDTYNPLDPNFKPARDVSQVLKDGKPISILLLGTDTGSLDRSYTGRTDSVMIATVNPKTKTTTLESIPRDSMVSIPGFEQTFPMKINAAYEFPTTDGKGHPETTIKTLQDFLNVPIDFYALINMGGLQTMVDKVGGVTVKSPLTFTYKPNNKKPNTYKFYKGKTEYKYAPDGKNFKPHTVMNGAAALAFSRMRYTDPLGDYGRQKRQRLVLTALAKQADDLANLLTPGFFESMSKNVQTNLSFNDLMTMASKYRVATKTIKSEHMQGVGYMYNGQSFQVIPDGNRQEATNILRKSLGLQAKPTGNRFAGQVTNGVQIPEFPTVGGGN
ncbi:LytR family transcriptional regulator [Periweissella cryptocerci]|uniref:LytR family transcriptional regulator n=1 Tax=Periweissella cryptocerci TaxID=2506420 RepID=A0A4P6YU34_9LACO|nr:LCP family protein [Periweissella cryptocerci]QBO36177.1 LytR family transcriptional regulator [Periweissella cryptocerci]